MLSPKLFWQVKEGVRFIKICPILGLPLLVRIKSVDIAELSIYALISPREVLYSVKDYSGEYFVKCLTPC